MEDAKRKQLETQLRQLINAANRSAPESGPSGVTSPGKIQVIRRRKGKPDRHIVEARPAQSQNTLQ